MNQNQLLEMLADAIADKDVGRLRNSLDAGANPNAYKPYLMDRPPMHEAALANFIDGMRVLKDAGALVDAHLSHDFTPLMVAVNRGHAEAVQWLLREGANPLNKSRDSKNRTALEIVLENGNVAMATLFLQERPDLRGQDLAWVVKRSMNQLRHLPMVQWLLDNGVSPDLTSTDGNPWIYTVQMHQRPLCTQMTDLLLQAGANINARNRDGSTALRHTVELMAAQDFMHLLRHGARADIPDDVGDTVRNVLQAPTVIPMHLTMRDLLSGWEASQVAHKVIQASATGIQPL